MADLQPNEGSSTSNVSGGSSGSILQLNIKTLDSRIYSFQVDKSIVVSAFKEKIASLSGVPVGQQRLIFRGKVLKDDHPLAAYNVENGDTLHLVERQLQPPPGSNSTSQGATSTDGSRGQAPTVGGPRNRIGHVAHSIVVGTLNAGDRGEAAVPDIGQVIGAVLNSVGIGNMTGIMPPGVQTSQGNATEGAQGNAGSQSRGGNQPVPGQMFNGPSAYQAGTQPAPWQMFNGQSAYQAMPIPLGAGATPIAVPTLNMPIPDSLSTLTDYMNRMEHEFSQNGNRPNQSPDAIGDLPAMESPMNSRGLPTIEAVSIVLRHAQRLLTNRAGPALSHTANRIDQERDSNDPAVRAQVQGESVQLGFAMQQLGALFLELGRTILNFRIGRSSSESVVNAGPAVYISPSGPNPIMVQPFPFQNGLLFGGSSGVAPNPVAMGPIGIGSIPRNVNIHIHTGASMVPMVPRPGSRPSNGDGMQGHVNRTESGDSGHALHGTTVSPFGTTPPVTGSSQDPDPNSISSIVAEINDHLRRSLANQNSSTSEDSSGQGQPAGSGAAYDGMSSYQRNLPSNVVGQTLSHVTPTDDQKAQTISQQHDNINNMRVDLNNETSTSHEGSYNRSNASEYAENLERPLRSDLGNDNPDASSAIPLGLGLGGLQPKRRSRQPKEKSKNSDSASGSSQNKQSREVGQQVLQSLASMSTRGNENPLPSGQSPDLARGVIGSRPTTAIQNAGSQMDAADAMSQMLESPALDGLLSGMSQQTGVGSPDMLRNMLQQFTQIPAMRNTVNQIAQQIDRHDLGSMFSDVGGGQGSQLDLSRMMQQMMPIVSQALGGVVSSAPQVTPPSEPVLSASRSMRDMPPVNSASQQIDLQQVVQRLEDQSSSEDIFQSLVDTAVNLSTDGSVEENVVDELCNEGELVKEFMEMLHGDISRRLQDGRGL